MDLTFPDNPKRIERLKTLSAQMDQNLRRMNQGSEKIESLVNDVKKDLHTFKQTLDKVIKIVQLSQTQILIAKLKQLIKVIGNLSQQLPVYYISNNLSFKLPKIVIELITSAFVYQLTSNRLSQYFRTLYMTNYFAYLVSEECQDWKRESFILKFPRWVQWNLIGKAGGLAAGAVFGFALNQAISAIFGSIQKSQLQKIIMESLDCRFMSQKARRFVDLVVKGLSDIKNRLLGGQAVLNVALSHLQKEQKLAYQLLNQLKIDDVIGDVKSKKAAITDGLLVDYLKAADKDKWTDDIESEWKPLTDQQFEKKYPHINEPNP